MKGVATVLRLQVRSQEAFEAICGPHGPMSGFSEIDTADGIRSCASAVVAEGGEEPAWRWHSPVTKGECVLSLSGGSFLRYSSSEIETGAAGGARSLRRRMRMLTSGRQCKDATNTTVAFIFERGPVIMWIAASDARAKDSRGRRELLSSLLFFLSQFASQWKNNGFSVPSLSNTPLFRRRSFGQLPQCQCQHRNPKDLSIQPKFSALVLAAALFMSHSIAH